MRFVLACAALALVGSVANAEDVYVHGYTRQDGTYVEPYHRSSPNSYTFDNYGSKGNTNPYSGERGSLNSNPSPAPLFGGGTNKLDGFGRK